jgi:hypothetical protein
MINPLKVRPVSGAILPADKRGMKSIIKAVVYENELLIGKFLRISLTINSATRSLQQS